MTVKFYTILYVRFNKCVIYDSWLFFTYYEMHFSVLNMQDEDLEALLAADFEIGHFIRERIVPRAVLYFTGEALENDDDVSLYKIFQYF